jgi:hypothetical protein
MDLQTVFTILGGTAAIFGLWSGWVNSKFKHLEDKHDVAMSRLDSTNVRIDSMGARIDTTQSIIMRMLEDRGK